MRSELNTGIMLLRPTAGGTALVRAWRRAMESAAGRPTNDQILFDELVLGARLGSVLKQPSLWAAWRAPWRARAAAAHDAAAEDEALLASVTPATRDVFRSWTTLEGVPFALGTLPAHAALSGHAFFVQHAHRWHPTAGLPAHHGANDHRGAHAPHGAPAHDGALAQQPLAVHFTFQFGDDAAFPYGKRQRAREAGLWMADPPDYFTPALLVRPLGALVTAAERRRLAERFPSEADPRRHVALAQLQRTGVRDWLALATALNATLVLPPLECACDKSWGLLRGCRHLSAPPTMRVPFACPLDSLFNVARWHRLPAALGGGDLPFRAHSFWHHPSLPAHVRDAAVRLTVWESDSGGGAAAPGSAEARVTAVLPAGAPLAAVRPALVRAQPHARVVELTLADLRRLRYADLGSPELTRRFNARMRHALADSASFCAEEENRAFPGWSAWERLPPDARPVINCTKGFALPPDLA